MRSGLWPYRDIADQRPRRHAVGDTYFRVNCTVSSQLVPTGTAKDGNQPLSGEVLCTVLTDYASRDKGEMGLLAFSRIYGLSRED